MVDSTNLWDVVVRTLVTSGSATVLAGVVAIGLAIVLANREWRAKPLLRGVTQALYGLPPVVVGVVSPRIPCLLCLLLLQDELL